MLLPPTEFPEQEFFVFRRDIKTLAGLLDDRRRPGVLLSEPCDSAAQGVPSWDDGRNWHWPLAVSPLLSLDAVQVHR